MPTQGLPQYQLRGDHPLVAAASEVFVAADGAYTLVGRKRRGAMVRLGSGVTAASGWSGAEFRGTGNNSGLSHTFTPMLSTLSFALGGVVHRRGTKTGSSGAETILTLGDGQTASGGCYAQILLDDGTWGGNGKLVFMVRYLNSGTTHSVVGPTMDTDGKPHAVVGYVAKRGDSGIAKVWFSVDGVTYTTTGDSTTSSAEKFGRFGFFVLDRNGTAGSGATSSSSASMGWFGGIAQQTDNTVGLEMYRRWTKDPYVIFERNVRRYWMPTSGTGGEISGTLAASLAVDATITGIVGSKTVTFTLKNRSGTVQANLTGLKWAWFDQATPNLLAGPTDKGSSLSTDGSGVGQISIPNSTLSTGQIGTLVISNSDGTITQTPAHIGFNGPVAVD